MNKFGKLLKLFFIFAFLVQIVDASNAIVAYRSSTTGDYCTTGGVNCPKIRFWDSEQLTWGNEIELPSSGNPVSWPTLKQSPISEKMVLTVVSGSYVHSYVCLSDCENPTSWKFTEKIKYVGALAQKRMDMEFIGNTDKIMVVYGTNSENGIKYKVFLEDENNFLTGEEHTVPNSNGARYTWVKLAKNNINENLILVGYNINAKKIYAWVWDGTQWDNKEEITSELYNSTSEAYVEFDAGYLSDSTKAYVFAKESLCNLVWKVWDGTQWHDEGTHVICQNHIGEKNQIRNILIKTNPTKNELRALILTGHEDGGQNHLFEYYVNNTITPQVKNVFNNEMAIYSSRVFDFTYLPDYSKGILIYEAVDSAHTNIKKRETLFELTDSNVEEDDKFEHLGRYLSLYRNPSNEDDLKVLGIRMIKSNKGAYKNKFQIGSFHYNGTDLINHGEYVLATDVGTELYEPYSLTFLHPHNVSIKIEEESITPSIGEILEFNITVENNGVYSLTDFEVHSELPNELTFDETNLPYTKSVNKIKWTINELGKGESIVIYFNATVNENTVNINEKTKEITTNVKINKKTGLYSINEEDSVNTTINFAGLSVNKESLNEADPFSGEIAMWKINITNIGAIPLNITEIIDNAPMGFWYNNSEPPPNYVDQYINIFWSPNEILNPGESKIIYLNTSIVIDVKGNYTNKVTVLARTESGHEMTFTGNGTIGTCEMSVNLTKTINKNEFYVGDVITFTLNITNDGDRNASILNIVDVLPAGVTFLEANVDYFSLIGNEIKWADIDMLLKDESFIVEYNVSANQVGEFTNEASLTAQSLCGCTIDRVSNVTFEIIKKSSGGSSSGGGSSSSSRELMKISKDVLCPNNVLVISTTTTRGTPVKEISVKLYQKTPYYERISEQITDVNGKAYFLVERSGNYEVVISGSGYVSENLEFTYEKCESVEELECKFNSDCVSDEYCSNGMCVKVEKGECGYIKEHAWVSYECCNNDDCTLEGYECKNNVCLEIVEPPKESETEEKKNESMGMTFDVLQNTINLIKINGGDVSEIERILGESKEYYELGNYDMAMELAAQASNLIKDVKIKGSEIVGESAPKPVESDGENTLNALLYVLVGVIGTLIIVGAVYFFTKKK